MTTARRMGYASYVMVGTPPPASVSILTLLVPLALSGCPSKSDPRESGAADSRASSSANKPSFIHRPANGKPLVDFVRRERERALAEQYRVLVYVGASWCEPCQRFHEALDRGELDAELSGIRFLEFDLDRDGVELQAGGYGSRMIPLFVVPEAGGRGSDLRIQGSIKGPGAVRENLLPRLRKLLDLAPPVPTSRGAEQGSQTQ